MVMVVTVIAVTLEVVMVEAMVLMEVVLVVMVDGMMVEVVVCMVVALVVMVEEKMVMVMVTGSDGKDIGVDGNGGGEGMVWWFCKWWLLYKG